MGKTTAPAKRTTLPTEHRYVCENGDGYKYRIPRIPIWTTHERTFTDPSNGKKIHIKVDSKRLKEVASIQNKRFSQDNYRPPIHEIHNNEPGAVGDNTGYMGRAYVEKAVFEGQERDVLFIDYLVDTDEKLEKIKNNPYRSVEVSPSGEISSLAVMKRKAPFFKFPLFRVKENTEGMSEETPPISFENVAFAYGEDSTFLVLYKDSAPFKEADAMDDQKKEKKAAPVKGEAKKKELGMDEQLAKYMASEAGQKSMEGHFSAYMSKMMADDGEDDAQDEGVKAPASMIDKAPKKGGDNYEEPSLVNYEMAGQIDALRAELDAIKAEKLETETITWALAETQDISRGEDQYFADKVQEIYSDSGVKGVQAYVGGMLSSAPRISDKTSEKTAFADIGDMPECVAKYQSNPKQYEAASRAYSEFSTSLNPSLRHGLTPAQYVDSVVSETAGY